MGYLAYDSDRLALLRRALMDALAELDSMSLSDAEAADTMRSIRATRASLRDMWLPRIGDVLRCRALTGNGANRSELHDLQDLRNAVAYEMAVNHGWLLVDDRSMLPQSLTAGEAAALGERLDGGDIAALVNTSGEREWLYRQLRTIAADPELTAAFLRAFSSWALLCNELGERLMAAQHAVAIEPSDNSARVQVAQLVADFTALGVIFRSQPQPAVGPPYYGEILAIAAMQPYAGAMLVSNLGLGATALAAMTDTILRRWRNVLPADEGYDTTLWRDMTLGGPNTADILFAALLATPGACTEYVRRSAGDPASMWISTADPTLTARVALEGTAPANISMADAGSVIQSWLDYFRSSRFAMGNPLMDGYPAGYRVTLAGVVAPYLAQFAVTNEDWGDSDASMEARLAGLAFLVKDGAALDALIDRCRSIVEELVAAGNAGIGVNGVNGVNAYPGSGDTYALKIAADTVGVIGQLAVNRAVANELQRQQLFELGWTVATIGTAWLSPVAGILAGGATNAIWTTAGEHLAVMPNPDEVEASAQLSLELGLVTILADLVAMMWRESRHRSPAPPTMDPTAKYPLNEFATELDKWLPGVEALRDPAALEIAESIDDAVSTFIARWSIASRVAAQN